MDCKKEIYDIRKYSNLSLKYQSFGFHVSFSGGKDSIVLYDLMKKSNVPFQGFFYNTGLEHPEIPIFIRKYYPNVIHLLPFLSFSNLVYNNGFLPSRRCRFCCDALKECHGKDSVVVDGVRKSESYHRSLRADFEFSCLSGRDKFFKHLLFDWSENRIWDYIHQYKLPIPKVYENFNRVGCIGCPMQSYSTANKEFSFYPKYRAYFIRIIQKCIDSNKLLSVDKCGGNAEIYFENWLKSFSNEKFYHDNFQTSIF